MLRRHFLRAGAVLAVARRARAAAAPSVLIIADERPAMEVLAAQIERRVHLRSEIITPDALPGSLASHRVLVVYIHKDLPAAVETASLEHARRGGTLLLLHHSISSHKRKNKDWFPALGVTLPLGDLDAGGYKYFDPVTFDLVNLAPKHPVMRKAPATFTLAKTEVYLNHQLEGPRTPLLGLLYRDQKTGRQWRQDTAGWQRPLGKGQVFYFMPGHTVADFEDDSYAQILANAVAR